ncbi:LysM peptidoglycan-binding domain-containing protein [Asanoa sp. WMMD1127]|uniref:LysM peptidoglycan-binding domain-containing protein n=1 Tax=Asanoa sp. WMMD1127 TaxID=3016107 RepID=UPI002417EA03|nr:LysM peptidoglycan-binding domain-containing protein [Asanoa sp. WMMD1127]MDG4821874.1 LysM peptidoglycan-binding domain-containing protein [Asanoa sp. WMMD1127]
MSVSAPRRVGQIVTGLGALVVLVGLVGGAPVALLAFAGNPLPDHVPTLAEIGTALTSRDDGRLFVRALAVVGWLGWATFAVSVLVELPFRIVRRPTPRLPGLRRQQRMAAALIGSALVLIGSPTTAAIAAPSYAPVLHVPASANAAQAHAVGQSPLTHPGAARSALAGSTVAHSPLIATATTHSTPSGPATAQSPPPGSTAVGVPAPARAAVGQSPLAGSAAVGVPAQARAAAAQSPLDVTPWASMPDRPSHAQTPTAGGAAPSTGVARLLPAAAQRQDGGNEEPRYQVERGDYLGAIADRYVGDFTDYPELARLNKIDDPDRIYPGQLLRLPDEARDRGYRPHASGMVIQPGIDDGHDPSKPPPAQPERPAQPPTQPAPIQPSPPTVTVPPVLPAPGPPNVVPLPPASPDENMAAGPPAQGESTLQINRPLAVSAVIAAAAIVGAQVGTVFGLRRRPAGTPVDGGRHRAEHD